MSRYSFLFTVIFDNGAKVDQRYMMGTTAKVS